MTEQIRVLIADDHIIVRSGLRLLLDAEPGILVVGEAMDGSEALVLAETLQPDVVLMDITMPGMNGMDATREIKRRWPTMKVLTLTMHRSDEYFFEMLKAGASGYVLKGAETDELVHALRVVASGEVFLYPSMTSKLVGAYLNRVNLEGGLDKSLSPREQEILKLLAEGYSNNEIADKLVISSSTVHTHRRNLMGKLGLNRRHELVEYARQIGLVR